MARDLNPLKSELITLSLNIQSVWYLDRLVETGLDGNNRTEAARVALYDRCKLLIADGKLGTAPALPGKDVTEARIASRRPAHERDFLPPGRARRCRSGLAGSICAPTIPPLVARTMPATT